MSEKRIATPRGPYDRKNGADKPAEMAHVRVGGWAEVCVGPFEGYQDQIVFGYIERIEGKTIFLRVADKVCSYSKTGLADGDLIAVELADLFGSEYSPFAQEREREFRRRAIQEAYSKDRSVQ